MNVFVSLCLPSEVSAPSKSTRCRWMRNSESLKAFEKTWKYESKQSLKAQFDASVHILFIILFPFGRVLIFRAIIFLSLCSKPSLLFPGEHDEDQIFITGVLFPVFGVSFQNFSHAFVLLLFLLQILVVAGVNSLDESISHPNILLFLFIYYTSSV